MGARPTALIADDEPSLREALTRQLAQAWPELGVVAQARNGRETIKLFESKQPDVCFLDVQTPGVSGIEAARHIAAARMSYSSRPTTNTRCRHSRRVFSTTW